MKTQALTVIEIETFTLSTSIAPDERRKPVSHDGGGYPSKPETRPRKALRWLIDSLALAGAGMAGVYASDLLERLRQPDRQERPAGLEGLNNNSFACKGIAGRSKRRPRSPREWTADSLRHGRSGEAKS
jgi:hypothetical protein